MRFLAASASIALWPVMAAVKVVLILLGPIVVPPCFWFRWRIPKPWAGTPGRPHTIWELVVRNPADGIKRYFTNPPADKQRRGGSHPGELESEPLVRQYRSFGWQWRRYRLYSMVRLMWIYPGEQRYGELFIGWKLGYEPEYGMDFALSLRPWADVGN